MPVRLGQRFLLKGSLPQVVMSYAVSEPGEWTAASIAQDIEVTIYSVNESIGALRRRGLILIRERSILPTETGKTLLLRSMERQ